MENLALRSAIRTAMTTSIWPQEIAHLALVLCGARPAAQVTLNSLDPALKILLPLIKDELAWRPLDLGQTSKANWPLAIVALDPTRAAALHAAWTNPKGLDDGLVGTLLGYPAISAHWYSHHRREGVGNTDRWSADELRFNFCGHSPKPWALAAGRTWAHGLAVAFRKNYGSNLSKYLHYERYPFRNPIWPGDYPEHSARCQICLSFERINAQ
jgi:hypothetical protein